METIDFEDDINLAMIQAIYDVMMFSPRFDIAAIGSVGSWHNTLDNGEIYEHLTDWLEYISNELKREDILEKSRNRWRETKDIDLKIRDIIVDLFDVVNPEDKTVSHIIAGWGEGVPDMDVLNKLEAWLTEYFKQEALRLNIDPNEQDLVILEIYRERQNRRMMQWDN